MIKINNKKWKTKCEEINNFIGSTRTREKRKVSSDLGTNKRTTVKMS